MCVVGVVWIPELHARRVQFQAVQFRQGIAVKQIARQNGRFVQFIKIICNESHTESAKRKKSLTVWGCYSQ